MWVRIELPSAEARDLFSGRTFIEGDVPYVRTTERAATRLYNDALPPGSPRRRILVTPGGDPFRIQFGFRAPDGTWGLDPECLVIFLG
jgi:hypothetical protein